MSGPSRAEIIELSQSYRALLGKMYPGQTPAEVCQFYAVLERRLATTAGTPDVTLREYGRLLKGWIEQSRGRNPLVAFHRHMLAAFHILDGGSNSTTALKRARVEVTASEANPKHWLHDMLPKFKDNILQTREASANGLGKLLREQLAEARPATA